MKWRHRRVIDNMVIDKNENNIVFRPGDFDLISLYVYYYWIVNVGKKYMVRTERLNLDLKPFVKDNEFLGVGVVVILRHYLLTKKKIVPIYFTNLNETKTPEIN